MRKALHRARTLAILVISLSYGITPIVNAQPYLLLDNNTDNICFDPPYSIKSCRALRLSYTLIKNLSLKGYTIKKSHSTLHAKINRYQSSHCEKISPYSEKDSPSKLLTLIPKLKFDLDVFALDPIPNSALSNSPLIGISINYRRCW